jgi:dimethylhistidine N-methyltransferase
MGDRLRFRRVEGAAQEQSFCAAVDLGLSSEPPFLPTRFLYDRQGSELFEQITEIPEYYLTGSEAQIFFKHAADIAACMPSGASLVEFGSGSSKKTRLLIEAMLWRQGSLDYYPIDISEAFLRANAELLLEDYASLTVEAVAGEYFDVAADLPGRMPRLILFLGSNIGNLERPEAEQFLRLLAGQMDPTDRVLVGIDLVKDDAIIEAAYNDAAGVTAAFNKNLLRRMNRELDGTIDVDCWQHEAPWDPIEQRIEMRLRSTKDQTFLLDAVGKAFSFRAGDAIHTEWSHKYTLDSFGSLAAASGLQIDGTWFDAKGWFASVLLKR